MKYVRARLRDFLKKKKKPTKSDNRLGGKSKDQDKNQASVSVVLSLSLEKYGTIYRPRISKGECLGNF